MATTRAATNSTLPASTSVEYVLWTGAVTAYAATNSNGLMTTAGTYVLHFDTTLMAAGDVIELRCYSCNIDNSPTTDEGLTYYAVYSNVQSSKMKLSVPVPVDNTSGGVRYTLKQVAGTFRTFPWKIVLTA